MRKFSIAQSPHTDGMGHIYLIRNQSNGMCYVGQTTSYLSQRLANHLTRGYFTDCEVIIGEIEHCLVEDLDERERYWIEYYDTMNNGYNKENGGYSGFTPSPATIINAQSYTGMNNPKAKVIEVTFSDGHKEIHHTMNELMDRGYSRSKISAVKHHRRNNHKDIIQVIDYEENN